MVYRVNVLVDWGQSFVDEDGSFYCGTTDEHKLQAKRIIETNPDLVLEYSDTHAINTPEFLVNGGLYPAHNLIKRDQGRAQDLEVSGKNVSPTLTKILNDALQGRNTALIAPRHTFFQSYDGGKDIEPDYTMQDVIDTYNVPLLDTKDFLEGKINHIIQTKHLFDGTDSRRYCLDG